MEHDRVIPEVQRRQELDNATKLGGSFENRLNREATTSVYARSSAGGGSRSYRNTGGGGSLLAVAAPAIAGTAVTNVDVTVLSDGSAPFDNDNDPGHDTGPNNGIVRAQDRITWNVVGSEAASGSSVYTMTLPAGMVFDASSAAATNCTGPTAGNINAAGNVLTCDRVMAGGPAALTISARVGSVAHGTDIALKVDVDGLSKTSTTVKVSATPKTELSVYGSIPTLGYTLDGARGVRLNLAVYLGATKDPANPSFFGYEALQSPFSFTVDVPAGVIPDTQTVVAGAGTITPSQPGGAGTPITYTVTGATTNFLNAGTLTGMPATMAGGNAYQIYTFLPYEGYIAPGATVQLRQQVSGFDPDSLSGQSNFGAGFAPGQEPSAACQNPAAGVQLNCTQSPATRVAGVSLAPTLGASWSSSSSFMFGDFHGQVEAGGLQNKAAVPGQNFMAVNGLFNAGSAEDAANGAYGSMAWDPTLMNLVGKPTLRFAPSGAATSLYAPGSGTALDENDYVVEYTDFVFVDDADRKARDSFTDPAMSWVNDAAQLPGGMAAVTSVRVKYLKPLAPNSTIALVTPLQRTLASAGLATGTRMPWFWQYGSASSTVVKSVYSGSGTTSSGGNVQASDALVRAEVAWQKVEGETYAAGNAQRGDLVNLKITPIVIGPVGNATTAAADTKVTVTMPNACYEPVASVLPANAQLTPGVPGANCATGTPATIVYTLGNLNAAGGDAGPAPYQGHATFLNALQVTVKVSLDTPPRLWRRRS
ncbi:hypothetical protein G7067_04410 [Leucobacter insecticola]|uniref:Uncharacterized protein n=1 Tax=Leucobacter insecticola TaxID=2714934 RepID=A0A6G8FH50_9MICO|nr:hypothetical protein [Leucobacter insecticola]QIM15826.1 hypothetical protein G7067_04410 [Leucobacter insecticola]